MRLLRQEITLSAEACLGLRIAVCFAECLEMEDGSSPYKGTVPQASFVMAFVKGEEISKFLMEQQPIRAIARHFDRNEDTVDRAIKLLKEHESAIAKGDVMTVAKVVWKGRLGWERSKSFMDARAYIESGELVPKRVPANKRRGRRKAVQTEQGRGAAETTMMPVNPISPTVSESPPKAIPAESRQVDPADSGSTPAKLQIETDDLLAELSSSMPLVSQASRVAAPESTPNAK